jgi:hypothetical protein
MILISALVVSFNGDSNEFWGIESCIYELL